MYKNTAFANWGKYNVSWNFRLVFIIDFQSWVPGSFDTVTSLHMEFHSERAAAGLGPSGLNWTDDKVSHTSVNYIQLPDAEFCLLSFFLTMHGLHQVTRHLNNKKQQQFFMEHSLHQVMSCLLYTSDAADES